MCIKTPEVNTTTTTATPPIEAPQFGNDELKSANKGKGLKIGTKKLQVSLGSTSSKSGLSITK